jgi:acetyl-CoA synthetase
VAKNPQQHNLFLRLLGSVGDPSIPSLDLVSRVIGRKCRYRYLRQTETKFLISPLPGLTTTKPGSATFPLPGINADVVDESGQSVPLAAGDICPEVSLVDARTIYGDPSVARRAGIGLAGCLFCRRCKRDTQGYLVAGPR